jgi:multidrug efflux pump
VVSQTLTLYTTPVIYLVLDRLHRRLGGTAGHSFAAKAGRRAHREREFGLRAAGGGGGGE